jgi:5-methylcytosine-specific restriction protein A
MHTPLTRALFYRSPAAQYKSLVPFAPLRPRAEGTVTRSAAGIDRGSKRAYAASFSAASVPPSPAAGDPVASPATLVFTPTKAAEPRISRSDAPEAHEGCGRAPKAIKSRAVIRFSDSVARTEIGLCSKDVKRGVRNMAGAGRKSRKATPDDGHSRCSLCRRVTPVLHLSKHHLTPRSRGGGETVLLCSTCHGQIHATFTNKELAARFDSLEKLRAAPELEAYLTWIAKQRGTQQFRRKTAARRRGRGRRSS